MDMWKLLLYFVFLISDIFILVNAIKRYKEGKNKTDFVELVGLGIAIVGLLVLILTFWMI